VEASPNFAVFCQQKGFRVAHTTFLKMMLITQVTFGWAWDQSQKLLHGHTSPVTSSGRRSHSWLSC